MKLFSNRNRRVDQGPYPLERLPRLSDPRARPPGLGAEVPPLPGERMRPGPVAAGPAFEVYADLFDQQVDGEVAPDAPIPDDPVERSRNLLAGLYFLDADMAGCCVVPTDAWSEGSDTRPDHPFAVVIVSAFTRGDGRPGPGTEWVDGTRRAAAELRAAELAVITASYIRNLGFWARAHTPTRSGVDLGRLALQAGLARVAGGELRAPFLRRGFALSAVTTGMEVQPQAPLARRGRLASLWERLDPRWLSGWGGTRAGWGRLEGEHRPLASGRYPMERIRRVDEPTTLIIEDEVPRVPVRAGGFPRAANGDMGPKFAAGVRVFAYKTPQAQAYVRQIRAMVPLQDGPVTSEVHPSTADPEANSLAVKALAHHLGGDMVGICEIPRYAWYSHRGDGTVVEPDHRHAVVILLDQGRDTMEGASGDDWVSGAQSMRAYMRGAQIAGIVASHIRSLGHGARSQTNSLSEVLHIPLVLHAGLGEMSRIGELVLNPFVGPRFKSVVVTTDLPLAPDRPIDFGLQDFCSGCTKCARECPCSAISFGDKIMFNGVEMWKPDVEKCTKYRIGNMKGAACGRCMKTCPFNAEGIMAERLALWAAIHLPFTRPWIVRLDDRLGHGAINPVKKWWWDLEWRGGRTCLPEKGTNARDLDPRGGRAAARQKIALYPADVLPPGDAVGVPVRLDRKEAVRRGQEAETPEAARRRIRSTRGR